MYGQSTPPNYNLDYIDIPVYLFAASQDLLATPEDTLTLVTMLRNCPKLWAKFYHVGHNSFMLGK